MPSYSDPPNRRVLSSDEAVRPVPPHRLASMAMLARYSPDLTGDMLDYLALWSAGKVNSGPEGPYWVDTGEKYTDLPE